MKSGSIICWCKWVAITGLFFCFTSCDVSRFYFKKRVGVSTAENKTSDSQLKPFPVKDSTTFSSTPTAGSIALAPVSADTLTTKNPSDTIASGLIKEKSTSYYQPIPPKKIERGHTRKSGYRRKSGFWRPFFMILLLLLILATFGYLIYLLGVFAFGLALALILCILIFIGLITLLSSLFAFILYLYGLLLYSMAHSYGRKVNPFK